MKGKRFLVRTELIDMEQGTDLPRTVATFAHQLGSDYPTVDLTALEIAIIDEVKYYLRKEKESVKA